MLETWRRLGLNDPKSHFAEDAVFVGDPKSEPVRGREAILARLGPYTASTASYSVEPRNLLVSGRLVFFEKIETIRRKDGQVIVLPCVTVVELNAAGEIAAWRDYWETSMAKVAGG